jgi:hypothetical protein
LEVDEIASAGVFEHLTRDSAAAASSSVPTRKLKALGSPATPSASQASFPACAPSSASIATAFACTRHATSPDRKLSERCAISEEVRRVRRFQFWPGVELAVFAPHPLGTVVPSPVSIRRCPLFPSSGFASSAVCVPNPVFVGSPANAAPEVNAKASAKKRTLMLHPYQPLSPGRRIPPPQLNGNTHLSLRLSVARRASPSVTSFPALF